MHIRHYYHVFAGGAWQAPVRDHFTALGRAGLDDFALTVGLIGSAQERAWAREEIRAQCRQWSLPEPVAWLEADTGFEQLTLTQVLLDVQQIPGEFAVLYMHSKGAYNNSDVNAAWRRGMTARLVGRWEHCTELLENHYDLVGCHYIANSAGIVFFAGNFWWAKASYLRHLPPQQHENRYTPEYWVTLGACRGSRQYLSEGIPMPKVADLRPGFPVYGLPEPPEPPDDQQAMSLGGRAVQHPPGQEPQGHFL